MGRLTEAFAFINCEKLPPKDKRIHYYTHLDTDNSDGLKEIRKDVLKARRKSKK